MSGDRGIRLVAVGRIALGIVGSVAPNLAVRLFGLSPRRNGQPYVFRLYAIRELVMGIGLLAARGDARRLWITTGVVCDVADAAAAGLDYRDGQLSAPAALRLGAVASSAVGLGVLSHGARDAPLP